MAENPVANKALDRVRRSQALYRCEVHCPNNYAPGQNWTAPNAVLTTEGAQTLERLEKAMADSERDYLSVFADPDEARGYAEARGVMITKGN